MNKFLVDDISDHELNISATNSNLFNESDIYVSGISFDFSLSKYNDMCGRTDIFPNITDVKDIMLCEDKSDSKSVTLISENSNHIYVHKPMLTLCKYCNKQIVHMCADDPIVIEVDDKQTYENLPINDNENKETSTSCSAYIDIKLVNPMFKSSFKYIKVIKTKHVVKIMLVGAVIYKSPLKYCAALNFL